MVGGGAVVVNFADLVYHTLARVVGEPAAHILSTPLILPYTIIRLSTLDPQPVEYWGHRVELVQREGVVSAGRMELDTQTGKRTFTVYNDLTGGEKSLADSNGDGLVDIVNGYTDEEAQEIFNDALRRYDLSNPKKR